MTFQKAYVGMIGSPNDKPFFDKAFLAFTCALSIEGLDLKGLVDKVRARVIG